MIPKPKGRNMSDSNDYKALPAAKPSVFDDLNAVRINPSDMLHEVAEVLATIPVRKPARQEFFRICPDSEMSLTTAVFIDKQDRDTTYFVSPAIRGAMSGEERIATLYHFVTTTGVMGIWPIALPLEGRQCAWTGSKLMAIEEAKRGWVRIVADTNLGAYRIYRAQGALEDAKFSTMSINEMLKIAFNGRVIETEDHPIIHRLRGL